MTGMNKRKLRGNEVVVARITGAVPGGYEVFIVSHELTAFLPTRSIYQPGAEIESRFACVYRGRNMLWPEER